jgi:hypothetical protein
MDFDPSSCGTSLHLTKQITTKRIHLLSTATPELFTTSVALVANTSNWRKVAKDLIGDEPVSYEEKSKKDTLRKFPVITISSTDKEALDRVLTKAAEVE